MDDCPYLTASYILAGLSMMLNIRLAYSSAPYALIRFRLPENLFSVFVRRMASALELWCLPSMLLGNIMDLAMKLLSNKKTEFELNHSKQQTEGTENAKLGILIEMKRWKFYWIIIPSIMTMWSDFITYLILLIIYVTGGDQGYVTAYYGVIAVSGFIFGINMTLVYAADWRYIPVYIAGENAFPMLTSIIHYFTTLMFGNRRKWNSDFLIVCIDIGVAIIISFTAAMLWTSAYAIMKHDGDDSRKFRFNVLPDLGFTPAYSPEGNPANDTQNAVTLSAGSFQSKATITVTGYNFTTLKLTSGQDLTITITSGTINNKENDLQTGSPNLPKDTVLKLNANGTLSGGNVSASPTVTLKGTIVVTSSGSHNIGTALTISGSGTSGGVGGTLNLQNDPGGKHVSIQTSTSNLTISDTAFGALTKTDDTLKIGDRESTPRVATAATSTLGLNTEEYFTKYWHLLPPNNYDSDEPSKVFPYWQSIFPALMIMVGMGFVYCIYPGIAPGMIVPFYLVDKIETVLLVLTTFPPVIIAVLQKHQAEYSPKYNNYGTFMKWTEYPAGQFYLFLDIIMVIKLSLLGIFIYCLHYRDSHISRSIVNQPKMSTFLTIVFYMCHEMLLALGFSGFIGNNGGDFILIPQYIGALLMIFLAFYSEGYIIEYKSHDPAHWPTEGMTKWNAFCYLYYLVIISLGGWFSPHGINMIKFNFCYDGYCDYK